MQDQPLSLRRETTEEMSKMYTTLYDNEDPQQQQEFNQLLQQQLQKEIGDPRSFIDALLSPPSSPWHEGLHALPASPVSSCFSGSSCSESSQSSPAPGSIKMIDADEADALIDMFQITIDDLLNGDPFSNLQYAEGSLEPASDFALFTPQTTQPAVAAAALHFSNPSVELQMQQQQQQQHNLHSHCSVARVGPHRSGSLSPVMSCAPYPATQHQSHHNHQHHHHHSSSSSQPPFRNARFNPSSPEQQYKEMMPHSPVTTYVSASPSPCISPAAPSTPYMPSMSPMSPMPPAPSSAPNTNTPFTPSTTLTRLPNTSGMTVVKNDDGSIMVYNPQTESMTFRCELCPNESFGRIHDLKRHQTSKHQDMTWPCEFCHRPFVRRDALLRHYTVKSAREDGIHPASHETEKLMAARARAKLIS
ncbi:hypothetical protein BGZ65_004912 [Modicella reniformis]|uniref:C2H2-type domain-containing protein n=1 Tax=Modicella reniformis TaxID=1440133 RepID=A0A9P6IY41_9FUNG|nr:hypothetical protein BGZ65_004912 [Modicella reniformis]